MNLRPSSEFVGPPAFGKKAKRPSKFIEILGTVVVALVTATVTIYGYKEANALRANENTISHDIENKKIDMEYAKVILASQDKKLEALESSVKALRTEVDDWREKYYKVVETRNLLQEALTNLQERYNKLSQELDSIKKRIEKDQK